MFIAFGMLIECLIELLHLIIYYYYLFLCALSSCRQVRFRDLSPIGCA